MLERRGPAVPSPDEVRDVVGRVVDEMLGSPAGASAGPPATASPSPATPAPEAAPGAPGQVTIAIGADHGGYVLKNRIGQVLRESGFSVQDCGTNGPDSVDYPDFAHAVARLVADGTCRWGIIVDGAGIGSCIVANKVPGVRAALCHDLSSARNSREHNHANVLTLGARFIGEGLAIEIVQAWLGTVWGYGRHGARVDKITAIERQYLAPAKEVRG